MMIFLRQIQKVITSLRWNTSLLVTTTSNFIFWICLIETSYSYYSFYCVVSQGQECWEGKKSTANSWITLRVGAQKTFLERSLAHNSQLEQHHHHHPSSSSSSLILPPNKSHIQFHSSSKSTYKSQNENESFFPFTKTPLKSRCHHCNLYFSTQSGILLSSFYDHFMSLYLIFHSFISSVKKKNLWFKINFRVFDQFLRKSSISHLSLFHIFYHYSYK